MPIKIIIFMLLALCALETFVFSESSPSNINGNIFGGRGGGHIHPFVSFRGFYTDNLEYEDKGENVKSAAYVEGSPGLYLSLPGMKIKEPGINILHVASPGGVLLKNIDSRAPGRFMSGLLGASTIKRHFRYDAYDVNGYNFQGTLQCRLKRGLAFKFFCQSESSADSLKNDYFGELSEYQANFIDGMVFFPLTEKIRFRLGYTRFGLDYDENVDAYKNRTDDILQFYTFYQIFYRLSFFLEYNLQDIKYPDIDPDIDLETNNLETKYLAGILLRFTDKLTGSLKTGVTIKDFENTEMGDNSRMIFEGNVNYYLTEKTNMRVMLFRGYSESDISGYSYDFVNCGRILFRHNWKERIYETLEFYYTSNDYGIKDEIKIKNKSGMVGIDIDYYLKSYMKLNLKYSFEFRNSNMANNDYKNNACEMGIQICI